MECNHQENIDKRITECASFIQAKRLEAPAIFLIELYKPLTGVIRETTRFFSPFILPFIGSRDLDTLLELLKDQSAAEKLLALLESPKTKGEHAGN